MQWKMKISANCDEYFQVIVESESASTIAIAKETLTRLANYRRIVLEEKVDVNESSIHTFLSLVSWKMYRFALLWIDLMFAGL